jgi:hypothetical protein
MLIAKGESEQETNDTIGKPDGRHPDKRLDPLRWWRYGGTRSNEAEVESRMNAASNVVRNENGATPAVTSSGNEGFLRRAFTFLKGALIVSAVVYVTIIWALQAAARFN